jgi:hypothetical protein
MDGLQVAVGFSYTEGECYLSNRLYLAISNVRRSLPSSSKKKSIDLYQSGLSDAGPIDKRPAKSVYRCIMQDRLSWTEH